MYQLGKYLVNPLFVLFFLFTVILISLWYRRRETKRRLAALTALYLAFVGLSLPVTGHFALLSLAGRYPPIAERPADAQVIVVLEGGELGSLYRCLRAAELYHGGPPCPVLMSGSPDRATVSSMGMMRSNLLRLGIPPEDILEEKESLSTYENAVNCRAVLDARGVRKIVLVTDGAHMPRAAACFRKQGFDVVAGHPVEPAPWHGTFFAYLPEPRALENCGYASQEWVGMGWYWLWGRV